MMTWSKDWQLSPVAELTAAGSVPVPLKPKSVEDTCKTFNLTQTVYSTCVVQFISKSENIIQCKETQNLNESNFFWITNLFDTESDIIKKVDKFQNQNATFFFEEILTNLSVADRAISPLSPYAGAVILVGEVESARVIVRLDESCRP